LFGPATKKAMMKSSKLKVKESRKSGLLPECLAYAIIRRLRDQME